ncbi:MAG: outer membrane beta-barrel protein [Bacteroidetes bacterium]|nr:outer membrane beta-barrel protein [Bacteroidota bacterium]
MGRKMTFMFLLLFYSLMGQAQIRFNPQAGICVLSIDDAKYKDVNTITEGAFSAEIGIMTGVDMRIGNKIYFQPGVFYSKSVSLANIKETVLGAGDTVVSVEYYADKLIRTTIKAKALIGFNPINKRLFKLRMMIGPTYDFIVGASNKGTEIEVDTRNFENGSFNLDAALGFDIYRITLEAGFTQGFTEAFDKNKFYGFDSKYSGYYITVGILLGKAKTKNNNDEKKEESKE